MQSALEWLVRGFSERSGIKISLDVEANLGRFTPEIELTLFRVTQEALNNVYRHSGSNTASIRLFRESGSIVLEIADCGKGMDASSEESEPSLTVGISGMQERVRDMGGTFVIESIAGHRLRRARHTSSAGGLERKGPGGAKSIVKPYTVKFPE